MTAPRYTTVIFPIILALILLGLLIHHNCCPPEEIVIPDTRTELISLKRGDTIKVTISSSDLWDHTGILLDSGATYRIYADPDSQIWVDGVKYPQISSPEGFNHCLLDRVSCMKRYPDAKWFTLMGSLGRNEESFFPIRNDTTYAATETAELVCFANDAIAYYHNNSGQLKIAVTRIK